MREAVILGGHESRRGAQGVIAASKLLSERGIDIVEYHIVADRSALRKRVKQAVKSGHKLIVVSGGDGAQTTAVGPLAYTDAVLGLIPGGTGNSFAQTLGIASDLEAAVEAIVNGRVARVDLGRVNGNYFANFSTIGLTAEVGARTPRWLKRFIGSFAYALCAIKPLATEKPFSCVVKANKKKQKLKTFQIVIANGRYFGTQPLLPDAWITDGLLSFFTTTGLSHLELVRMYLAVVAGTQTLLPDAQSFSAKKIVIKTRGRHLVSIDGDFGGYTPAKFTVERNALRVMVPLAGPSHPDADG
ncbi:MAG: YegS/Rv2252/BmrU family lipid kinase [Candidatus Eremiobacteraeota bacterium]|nr:YegS/Rv2252/BmrU family lipid kinase [Candidatus Eremiobacteraeota bacterium]